MRDQVEAFRRRDDLEVELFAFGPGPRALARAALALRSRYRGQRFDIVHAHFGLTAWPALLARLGPVVVTLHGNDLLVRRSYLATRAALPFTALAAAVSREFSANLPGAGVTRRVAVLPVGIDLQRFRPIPRAEARERLGLDPDGPYLLFPHDPVAAAEALRPRGRGRGRRAVADARRRRARRGPVLDQRRQRRARAVGRGGVRAVGDRGARVRRARVRDAGRDPPRGAARDRGRVLRASGTATRGARRCGRTCEAADPRVDGRARAELFSADAMAARVVEAWRDLLGDRTS